MKNGIRRRDDAQGTGTRGHGCKRDGNTSHDRCINIFSPYTLLAAGDSGYFLRSRLGYVQAYAKLRVNVPNVCIGVSLRV